jgi:serine/threonine-protein kinase
MKSKDKKKIEDKKLLSGRYEIIELIGAGSMSYVYKAMDTQTKKIVAIKILRNELNDDETFIKGFKNEAHAAINLKSENIISGYSVVDEKDLHYIVMELAEGISLKKFIMQHGALSNEETIEIGKQIVNGIISAHKI